MLQSPSDSSKREHVVTIQLPGTTLSSARIRLHSTGTGPSSHERLQAGDWSARLIAHFEQSSAQIMSSRHCQMSEYMASTNLTATVPGGCHGTEDL